LRNYKVDIELAQKVLSFHPSDDIRSIVRDLISRCGSTVDWENPSYYNIRVFRLIEEQSAAKVIAGGL
jgi:hypothetical protein